MCPSSVASSRTAVSVSISFLIEEAPSGRTQRPRRSRITSPAAVSSRSSCASRSLWALKARHNSPSISSSRQVRRTRAGGRGASGSRRRCCRRAAGRRVRRRAWPRASRARSRRRLAPRAALLARRVAGGSLGLAPFAGLDASEDVAQPEAGGALVPAAAAPAGGSRGARAGRRPGARRHRVRTGGGADSVNPGSGRDQSQAAPATTRSASRAAPATASTAEWATTAFSATGPAGCAAANGSAAGSHRAQPRPPLPPTAARRPRGALPPASIAFRCAGTTCARGGDPPEGCGRRVYVVVALWLQCGSEAPLLRQVARTPFVAAAERLRGVGTRNEDRGRLGPAGAR
jgi:hypothetical protein